MALDIYASLKNTYKALLDSLRVATSNANNFNTSGYKASSTRFAAVFARIVQTGTESTNPISLGQSVQVSSVSTDYSPGPLSLGGKLDTAIVGEGFFITSASSQEFGPNSDKTYTRAGRFQVDFNNEYLVDGFGRKIFGYQVNQNGGIVSNELVPIQTDGERDIGFVEGGVLVNNFQAQKDAINAGSTDAPEQTKLYRLAISSFHNKEGLIPTTGTSWEPTLAAGTPITPGISGEGIYGDIIGESLEGSNVDVAKVALDMTLINRALNAVNGIIDDVNKMISNLISKLAG